MNQEILIRRKKDLPWQFHDNGAVILNPEHQKIHELNEIGLRIWNLCDEKISIGKLREKIQSDYDVDSDILKQDIESFIALAMSFGIMEQVQ